MTLVLSLPFDEPLGSSVAQDFSGFGNNATLYQDYITPGRQGNSLLSKALGATEVSNNLLNVNQDYTIYFWLMCQPNPAYPHTIRAFLSFAELNDQVMQMDFGTSATSWTLIVLTKQGNTHRAYANAMLIDTAVMPTEYTRDGVIFTKSYLNDRYEMTSDSAFIDQFTMIAGEVYDLGDIRNLIFEHTEKLGYFIKGQDLKSDLGWTVEDARGLVGRNSTKSESYDWPDRHGVSVDLFGVRYREKHIELDIFKKFQTKEDAIDGIAELKELLSGEGLFRFQFVGGSRSIVYEVYVPGEINPEIKKWIDGKVVAKVTVELVEPEPVKKILQFVRTGVDNKTATVNFNANRELYNIYWGDGSMTANVTGETATASHEYTADGEYYIIIAGVIENMTAFASNTVQVWPRFI